MEQPQGANISGRHSLGFPQIGRAPLGQRTVTGQRGHYDFCERLSHTTDLYFQQKITSRPTAYFRDCQHPELTHTEVTEALTVLEVC